MIDVRLSALAATLAGLTVVWGVVTGGQAPAAHGGAHDVSAAAGGATGPARVPRESTDVPRSAPTVGTHDTPTSYGPVTAVRPSIRILGADAADALEAIRGTPGVESAATVRIGSVRLNGSVPIVIAAVDPGSFRRLTPQPTADAVEVWQRLDDGEAAFTHQRAQEWDLTLGGYVRLGGPQVEPVRVGAFASNGTPPIADAIVGLETGSRLGLDRIEPTVLAGTAPDADVEEIVVHLRRVTDAEVEVIPDPRVPAEVSGERRRGAATVWDALAMCESSGDWHLDSRNGFYGGLQFLPESWWMVGGRGMPHEASREEQIHRAELLLQVQGWRAWPVCSVRLGLRPPDDPAASGP